MLPLVWFILLPRPDSLRAIKNAEQHPDTDHLRAEYSSVPIAEADASEDEEEADTAPVSLSRRSLSLRDKWTIVSPLLLKYMLPLCKFVYAGFRNTLTLS